MISLRDFSWSKKQKEAARAAFELALHREVSAIREEAESILRDRTDDRAVWKLHDYLSEKRYEIDQKYDYRYSVLIRVFIRLVLDGWLTLDELSNIGDEKLKVIEEIVTNYPRG